MRPTDDELSALLAEAAPRAPKGTADVVLARARAARALRIRAWSGAVLAFAAAAVLLLFLRGKPPAPHATTEARTLAPGQSWTVGDALTRVRLDAPGEGRLRDGVLYVVRGSGRMYGHGARLDAEPARVTAEGVGAEVEFEVEPRGAVTLLAVHVVTGGARIDPRGPGGPTRLGPGERALVASGAPVLAVRTPRPAAPPPAAQPGARQEASTNPGTPQRQATGNNDQFTGQIGPGDLDLEKADVTEEIRTLLPQFKDCFEKALESHPDLSGRLLVQFQVRGHDGKGTVEEGEIIPGGDDDIDSIPVEQCFLDVISKAEFKVKGDGVSTVTYPFVLLAKPAEGDEN
jgi:hypothetical protein